MHFLSEYALFLAKTVTFTIALIAIIATIFSLKNNGTPEDKQTLSVNKLNDKFQDMADTIQCQTLDKQQLKMLRKAQKLENKVLEANKKAGKFRKKIYLLNFDGDVKAAAVAQLRDEISAVLMVATSEDEVVVNLESPGGMVHSYGLAASQLERIKQNKIPLTICVDKIAASGGYLMACVADTLIAAPFSIIGSIGVVTEIPNIHRLLEKNNVDVEQITAGQYKRTLTLLGKNTDEARKKVKEELNEIHDLFKAFIAIHRPQLDLTTVATGEHWLGAKAHELGLIDEIGTSDDYLLGSAADADIYEVRLKESLPFAARLMRSVKSVTETSIDTLLSRLSRTEFMA